ALGVRARAGRIAVEARARLAEVPPQSDSEAHRRWVLRLEGILREIDAGFLDEDLDEELREVRGRLATIVTESLATVDGRAHEPVN
ncbi:MAG: hypothetical protein ACR2RL_05245, partial [Gammaproteobacteria bacterium]